MFRFVALSLALVTLSGCLSLPTAGSTKPTGATSATPSSQALFSKSCAGPDACELTVLVKFSPPTTVDVNCKDVRLEFSDGVKFESLEIKKRNGKQEDVTLNFKLVVGPNGADQVFFGSNPLSFYADDKVSGLKKGPLIDAEGKFKISNLSATAFTMTFKEKGPADDKDTFHFGVSLGTQKGGCLADPRIVNGT